MRVMTNQENSRSLLPLLSYIRSRIEYLYNPAMPFGEERGLREKSSMVHHGIYVLIESATGDTLAREGYLQNSMQNYMDSVDTILNTCFNTLKSKNISYNKFASSRVVLTIVKSIQYIPDSLSWDENEDGVYMQWGQKYKALYLPYQIQKMGLSKIDTLDRLCAWETGLASSLWRVPEMLIYRLKCLSAFS